MTRSWLLVIPMRPTLTNAVHNNEDQTYTGAQVAAMLRDGEG